LTDAGVAPDQDVVVWDWRTRTATPVTAGGGWDVELEPEAWDYRVVAPVLPGGIAVIGDPAAFATAADRRLRVAATDGGADVVVAGAPGEQVEIVAWAAGAGTWTTTVTMPDTGWSRLVLTPP